MKNAIKTSEESWIEQQMLEDKKRATDWEATNEAIEEQVARESYLQWLRDQEKQARQVRGPSQVGHGLCHWPDQDLLLLFWSLMNRDKMWERDAPSPISNSSRL